MLGKIVSLNSHSHASLSQNRLILVIVLILSVREKLLSNFDSSREIRENEFWHSNCQKKKEGKKTKELKGEKRQLRADYACAQRKKQEEKMAGSDIVRGGRNKREVETLNALTIHHQLVKELTRTENCCPCKISCQIVNFN